MQNDITIDRIKNKQYEIAADLIINERMGSSIHGLNTSEKNRRTGEISRRLELNHHNLWNLKKETHTLIDIAIETYNMTCDELEREKIIPPLTTHAKDVLNEMRKASTENE